MHKLNVIAALAACAAFATSVDAQVLNRALPQVASTGDLVIFEGSNLANTTAVRFDAYVGGFVGFWSQSVTPASVTATRVTALVPQFGFAPPNATPPGVPVGAVALRSSGGSATATVEFFYLQATWVPPAYAQQQTTTIGTGTTQSTGQGRAVVSFDIGGGAPTPGNAKFVMRLENAVPNTGAALIIGFPARGPFSRIGDGTLVIDLTQFVLLGAGTDARGVASIALPIPGPGPFGVTLVHQWLLLDLALPGKLAISNGLSYIL